MFIHDARLNVFLLLCEGLAFIFTGGAVSNLDVLREDGIFPDLYHLLQLVLSLFIENCLIEFHDSKQPNQPDDLPGFCAHLRETTGPSYVRGLPSPKKKPLQL